mgnify:CR=1 FL=1
MGGAMQPQGHMQVFSRIVDYANQSADAMQSISLATSLYRAAVTGLIDAAREVREHGSFGYLDRTIVTPDLNAYLKG